ncbi:hypothetical protein K1X76_05865 [bacterium]|nr:hypothetical protein [bacterium]
MDILTFSLFLKRFGSQMLLVGTVSLVLYISASRCFKHTLPHNKPLARFLTRHFIGGYFVAGAAYCWPRYWENLEAYSVKNMGLALWRNMDALLASLAFAYILLLLIAGRFKESHAS